MMIFRIDHLAAIAEVEGLVANKLNHAIGHIFKVNLAELGRRTGLSRKTLRNLQKNGFVVKPHGNTGRQRKTVLSAEGKTAGVFCSILTVTE